MKNKKRLRNGTIGYFGSGEFRIPIIITDEIKEDKSKVTFWQLKR